MAKKIVAYLKMSRVSNLPTVWSNALAAWVIAGGGKWQNFVVTAGALSLYYIAGMFLNDACDAKIDAQQRPERSIPSGCISRKQAFAGAFLLLLTANTIMLVLVPTNYMAVSGTILTLTIVIYNFWHKNNPIAPFIMALCRFMVYVIAAAAVISPVSTDVMERAAMLGFYIVGLTYIARQENLKELRNIWPLLFFLLPLVYIVPTVQIFTISGFSYLLLLLWLGYCLWLLQKRYIGSAVGKMIAGISLLDALFLTCANGGLFFTGLAVAAFILTLMAHRWVPGT